MGNKCLKPFKSHTGSDIDAVPSGIYIASPITLVPDTSPTNNNNNYVDNPFIKLKRNGGMYILSAGEEEKEPATLASVIPVEPEAAIQVPVVPNEQKSEQQTSPPRHSVQYQKQQQPLPAVIPKPIMKTPKPTSSSEEVSPHRGRADKHTTRGSKSGIDGTKQTKISNSESDISRIEKANTEKTRQSKSERAPSYSLRTLRKVFNHDFQTFLLNNILLAVNFGDERNMMRIARAMSRGTASGNASIDMRQKEMSSRLTSTGHRKRVICPDALHEHFASMVKFWPPSSAGSNLGPGVPLRPIRVMICHEDIDVVEHDPVSSDSGLWDQAAVCVSLEQTENPGFVKLRNWSSKATTPARSSMASYEDMEDNDYSRLSDFDTHKSGSRESVDTYSSEISSEAEDKINFQLPPRRSRIAAIAEINDSSDGKMNRTNPEFVPNELLHDVSSLHRPISHQFQQPHFSKSLDNLDRTKSRNSRMSNDFLTPTERRLSAVNKYQSKHPKNNPSGPAIQIGNMQQGSNSSNNSSGYNTSSTTKAQRLSMDSTSDSDYGYATIRKIKTVQTLEERREKSRNKEKPLKIGLPETCFTPLMFRYLSDDLHNKDLFQTKKYLSSHSFMDHFNNLFVDELGQDLGFAPTYINNATVCGATISCQTTSLKLNIIPTIHCSSWPAKAVEWMHRSRSRALDQRTNKIYTWPTNEMKQHVQETGYQLVPLGYTGYSPRRVENRSVYLEWTIEFPEAEKYLESCLQLPQMRCYMFCLLIFQSFLTVSDGMTENHLRHIIFWQAENMTLTWSNCEMFNNIHAVFAYMYMTLSKKCLQNYFIHRKNEYQGIPKGQLHVVQNNVHNFRENPLGHILAALKCVNYINNPYPILDYDALLRILKANSDVELVNPALAAMVAPPPVVEIRNKKTSDTESEGFWAELKNKDPQRLWNELYHKTVEEEKKKAEAKKKIQQNQVQPVKQQGRPKIEVNLMKFQPSAIRKRLILEFFIEHFIKLARKSVQFRLRSQTNEYLAHTENLLILLEENGGTDEIKSEEYRSQLEEISEALENIPRTQFQVSPTTQLTMKPRKLRKPLELPKNADLYNEIPLTEPAIIENWHLQYSDYSEAQSTDLEYWRNSSSSSGNFLRNVTRSTIKEGDDDGNNTDM